MKPSPWVRRNSKPLFHLKSELMILQYLRDKSLLLEVAILGIGVLKDFEELSHCCSLEKKSLRRSLLSVAGYLLGGWRPRPCSFLCTCHHGQL